MSGEPSLTRTGPGPRTTAVACGLLILVFLALSVTSGLGKSPTADENRYAGFGKYLLNTGDLENLVLLDQPPLPHLIISAPFLLIDTPPASGQVRDPMYHSRLGRMFLLENSIDRKWVLLIGRSAVGLCAAMLAAVLALAAYRRYGGAGAILSSALIALCPSFLAHSRVMTSDVIAALFLVTATLVFTRFLDRPGRNTALLAGGALGLALLAKVNGLLLLPAFGAAGFVHLLRVRCLSWLGRATGWGAAVLVLAGLLLWVGYGFSTGPIIPTKNAKLSEKLWLDHWEGAKRGLLTETAVPAPAYGRMVMYVGRHSRRGHAAFMNGEVSPTGFPLFYPFVLAMKLPLGTLALILLTVLSFFRRRPDAAEATVLVVAGALLLMAIRSKTHIGIRSVLPSVAMLYLLAGRIPAALGRTAGRLLPALLIGATVVSTALAYPHYLAYMNEAAGAPSERYQRLVDSNLDWGQDLIGLRRFMEEEGVEEIGLAYFGAIDPAAYGIRFRPVRTVDGMQSLSFEEIAGLNPGYTAISATNLQNVYAERFGDMAWAKRFTPVRTIGHTIFVYRFDAE